MSENETKRDVLALISARTSVDEKLKFTNKCKNLGISPSIAIRRLVERWTKGEIKLNLED